MKTKFIIPGLAVVALVLIADQITKVLALKYFSTPIAVLPFFNLVLAHNTGISFGLFSGGGMMVLTAPLLIAAGFGAWLTKVDDRGMAIAIGGVIGGALGNVIDRVRLGAVVDFLDFHWGHWHYWAFNVADSCIVTGIAFIVLDGLFFEPKRKRVDTAQP